ncbi:MAG: manganese efflux pump [Deltaproteobacteria bacterium]|jgi:putative Mn2+ efflux pump MntP|nr:MAG: manganese efflux pump [Deltaproteobacteria bacterium]
MDFLTILLIALALAVDAFAVALAAGVSLCQVSGRQTFRLAFHFGLFQAMMNIIGWAAGLTVRTFLEGIDHWLAFGLLALVAAKMIKDSIAGREAEAEKVDPTKGYTLVMLSVATSIDSLAVGLSFSVLNVSIWLPAAIIGIIATLMTVIGLKLGCLLGTASRIGARAEIIGGLVLLGIGFNILHQHGVF